MIRTMPATYLERPLSVLPRADARTFVTRLYAPDQRFARGFYFYWRTVMGASDAEARRNVERELSLYGGLVLENLSDPCQHTIGLGDESGYQPIGLFAFRPLLEYEPGRLLHEHLRSTGQLARYPGPLAIGHSVAILNEHACRSALETILLSIARKALEQDVAWVFFWASDVRLATLYRHYNIHSSAELMLPGSSHVVGVYETAAPANLERMAQCARRLGVDVAVPAHP